jgi:hypothetical protein
MMLLPRAADGGSIRRPPHATLMMTMHRHRGDEGTIRRHTRRGRYRPRDAARDKTRPRPTATPATRRHRADEPDTTHPPPHPRAICRRLGGPPSSRATSPLPGGYRFFPRVRVSCVLRVS